jgi:hypothetical protein
MKCKTAAARRTVCAERHASGVQREIRAAACIAAAAPRLVVVVVIVVAVVVVVGGGCGGSPGKL